MKNRSLYIQKNGFFFFFFLPENGFLPYSIPSLSPSLSHLQQSHTATRRNVLEYDFFVPVQVFFNTAL